MASNRDKSNQKIAAWAIGLITIFALIIGVWRIYTNVTQPFEWPETNTNYEFLTEEEEQLQQLVELQSTDTDSDGLSDFDELYVYETSPYLADSDSDEISDKDEIEKGADPNCPEGTECGVIPSTNIGNTNSQQVNTNQSVDSSLTAEEIRSILQGAGAPTELLDSLSDQEIMDLYYETVAETGISPLENINVNQLNQNVNGLYDELLPTDAEYTYDDLRNLTADEIRDLLEATGADMSLINELDDEAIIAIFNQSLDEEIEKTYQNININQ